MNHTNFQFSISRLDRFVWNAYNSIIQMARIPKEPRIRKSDWMIKENVELQEDWRNEYGK